MADSEKEVIELERKYWQAIVDQDIDTILELSADPAVVTGSQGVGVVDHATYRKMMEKPNWELLEYELEGIQTKEIAPDVVSVAYTVTENMVVDGKPLTLKAADVSIWVRQNGSWVCPVHTESILGDPFGRDRKPMDSKPAARKNQASSFTESLSKRKPAARKKPAASRRRKVRG